MTAKQISIKKRIFAYKYKGKYHAEHLIESLDDELYRLEYGDVANDEYEIWEYPNGKMYKIVPDRISNLKGDYSTPNPKIWLPILQLYETNPEFVKKEYDNFRNRSYKRHSILKRMWKFIKR